MKERGLKYLGYDIVMQEVPNEISLAINISGCQHRCKGCHSEYLWEYKGNYIKDDIQNIISEYDGLITCVCFMGGEQNIVELQSLIMYVKSIGLKTCLYSGEDDISKLSCLFEYCNYIKCGRYIEELSTDDNIQYGIKLATSNQHIYKKGIDY